MSNKGTRKGRLYGEKKIMATTVINFNVHGKLSSPSSKSSRTVELMKEMCHMKAAITNFQESKWHENREVKIKGLGKIPKDMQKEEQKNKKDRLANIHSKKRKNQETIKLKPSSQF